MVARSRPARISARGRPAPFAPHRSAPAKAAGSALLRCHTIIQKTCFVQYPTDTVRGSAPTKHIFCTML